METKAVQAAADLDAARCRGNWAAVPELAKRYKRYHPDESDVVVCLEAELVEQIDRFRHRSPIASVVDDTECHWLDTPQTIYVPAPLNFDAFESLSQRLTDIVSNRSNDLDTVDDRQAQFAKILLARVYYETGQYDKALEALQNLALNINDATLGYGLVLLTQARTIKGMCFEQQGNLSEAQDAFGAAWDIVEKHLDQKNEMLSSWIEESLYHGALLALRAGAPAQKTLRMMRGYSSLSDTHFPAFPWRKHKRMVIFKAYATYLTQLSIDNASILQGAVTEIYHVTEVLQAMSRGFIKRDDPNKTSKHIIELVDIIVTAHDSIGWGDTRQIRSFLQFLQLAKEYTFNSPCITRHLFYTLLRVGSFDEAKHAFRAYMGLCGASDLDKILESESLDIKEIHISVGRLVSRLRILKDESWAPIEEETIQVLLAGVDLYGHQYQNGKAAVVMAEIAVELMRQLGRSAPEVQEECYRMGGIAYGLYAIQSDSPETRSEQHQRALHMLQCAINLHDDHQSVSWKTWYELAVQQAVMRDVYAALNSVTRSLQINREHLPSWHLLALISSCKQNDNRSSEALQVIETGIEQSKILQRLNRIPENMPVLSWSAEKSRAEYFNLAESYLLTCMSQIQLLEKLEGVDAVLILYRELFALYTKLSTDLGLDNDDADPQPRKNSVVSVMADDPITMNPSRRSSYDRPRSNSMASATSYAPRSIRSSTSEDTRSDRKSSPLSPSGNSNNHQRSLRKKSMQLIDVGFVRRIGTSTSQASTRKNSSSSAQESTFRSRSASTATNMSESSLFSLLSATKPSFLAGKSVSKSLSKANPFIRQRREHWHQILVKLWLLSTTTYIRAGMLEEATKAIIEAEQQILVGQMNDAGVWHQLGIVFIKEAKDKANKDLFDTGLDAFKKALAINPDHVDTLVDMAHCFMEKDEWEVAEGLLDRATQGYGWDNAEAWYHLSVCYRHANDLVRAKDCLSYSLELSETTPLQSFGLLPRFVN
ncbi:hypothetical protein BX666DRAFT_2030325 [Dichotomocladium elegans]|nr:hypothetical protein BX666DRAFT_2030325 [Dichotomocladium elegans]